MLSAIFDFSVQRSNPPFLSSRLSKRELCFISSVKGLDFDLAAIGKCGEVFQAKVDCDRRSLFDRSLRNFNLDVEVPSAARVLGEASGLDLGGGRNGPRKPKPVFVSEHNDESIRFFNSEGARITKWYPTKRTTFSRTPIWTFPRSIAGHNKLTRNRVEGVAINTELATSSSHQANKIKMGRPGRASSLRLALNFATIIPCVIR